MIYNRIMGLYFKHTASLRAGFTLLELLIVIAILGVLMMMIQGNFLTSLTKGRDARRKADLGNTQKALELYYEDKLTYPLDLTFGSPLCETDLCVSGEKIYMQTLPEDPRSEKTYYYDSDGTYYRLYSCIENSNDSGPGVIQLGYSGTDCGPCPDNTNLSCKYGISSSNTLP